VDTGTALLRPDWQRWELGGCLEAGSVVLDSIQVELILHACDGDGSPTSPTADNPLAYLPPRDSPLPGARRRLLLSGLPTSPHLPCRG
jgi:hypothetical protein